jgi:hypothetical protein
MCYLRMHDLGASKMHDLGVDASIDARFAYGCSKNGHVFKVGCRLVLSSNEISFSACFRRMHRASN